MKKASSAILLGVLCALILLGFGSSGFYFSQKLFQISQKSRQTNFINAAGETTQSSELRQIEIRLTSSGAPVSGFSGSADGTNWVSADNEVLTLASTKFDTVTVVKGNRQVQRTLTPKEVSDGNLTIDLDAAPEAPEILIVNGTDLRNRTTLVYPASNADEAAFESGLSGVEITEENGEFLVHIPKDHHQKFFHFIKLRAANPSGSAETTIGILNPPEREPTPIYTFEDFDGMRRNLSGSYRLMNDLDLSSIENWTPIGTEQYPWEGFFDGGGFAVRGFSITKTELEKNENGVSFFGATQNAVIRNLRIIEPKIRILNSDPRKTLAAAIVVRAASDTLIENIGVFGGEITSVNAGASGIIAGMNRSVLSNLFNSATVTTDWDQPVLYNTAGILGIGVGYIRNCANEGAVYGRHLTGGITGLANATISRTINSGRIYGLPLVGEYPPGGIFQTSDSGHIYDSLFTLGSAVHGGAIFSGGIIDNVRAISQADLTNPEALAVLGSFSGSDPDWIFNSSLANGPIPAGIFSGKELR